jgi:large-conductance mechanosensitive channel
MTVLAASSAAGNVVSGVLAFLVVAAMGIALFFLLRSMNKQLRKVTPVPPRRPGENRAQGRDPAGPGHSSRP